MKNKFMLWEGDDIRIFQMPGNDLAVFVAVGNSLEGVRRITWKHISNLTEKLADWNNGDAVSFCIWSEGDLRFFQMPGHPKSLYAASGDKASDVFELSVEEVFEIIGILKNWSDANISKPSAPRVENPIGKDTLDIPGTVHVTTY